MPVNGAAVMQEKPLVNSYFNICLFAAWKSFVQFKFKWSFYFLVCYLQVFYCSAASAIPTNSFIRSLSTALIVYKRRTHPPTAKWYKSCSCDCCMSFCYNTRTQSNHEGNTSKIFALWNLNLNQPKRPTSNIHF